MSCDARLMVLHCAPGLCEDERGRKSKKEPQVRHLTNTASDRIQAGWETSGHISSVASVGGPSLQRTAESERYCAGGWPMASGSRLPLCPARQGVMRVADRGKSRASSYQPTHPWSFFTVSQILIDFNEAVKLVGCPYCISKAILNNSHQFIFSYPEISIERQLQAPSSNPRNCVHRVVWAIIV